MEKALPATCSTLYRAILLFVSYYKLFTFSRPSRRPYLRQQSMSEGRQSLRVCSSMWRNFSVQRFSAPQNSTFVTEFIHYLLSIFRAKFLLLVYVFIIRTAHWDYVVRIQSRLRNRWSGVQIPAGARDTSLKRPDWFWDITVSVKINKFIDTFYNRSLRFMSATIMTK